MSYGEEQYKSDSEGIRTETQARLAGNVHPGADSVPRVQSSRTCVERSNTTVIRRTAQQNPSLPRIPCNANCVAVPIYWGIAIVRNALI
jgi:hypothetical protein